MKIIEPTHEEIVKYLNCVYYGCYDKNKCQCHNPRQFKSCYENAKKQLTRTELNAKEIEQGREINKKTWGEINSLLDEVFKN